MARHRNVKQYLDEDIEDADEDEEEVTGTSVDDGHLLSTSLQKYMHGDSPTMSSLQQMIESQRTPVQRGRGGASGGDEDEGLAEILKKTDITPKPTQPARPTYGKGFIVDASVFGAEGPPPSPTVKTQKQEFAKPRLVVAQQSSSSSSQSAENVGVSSVTSSPAPSPCPGTPTRERSDRSAYGVDPRASPTIRQQKGAGQRGSGEKARSAKDIAQLEQILNTRHGGKHLLNLVVVGHVDAGKSTLMGHLLFQLGFVDKKTMHRHKTDSEKIGKGSFAFAWVFDETDEERSRGVTIDVGHMRFETKTRIINLMDAPGHRDFVPNMITGASQADVAILVVNATKGEFESGFEAGGQTREHALLLRALGVTQIVVAVNKMDTITWSEERFKEIVAKLGVFLRSTGFKENDVFYVPVSGLLGLNLTSYPKEVAELKQWYTGPCLVDQIDLLVPPDRGSLALPTRFCVVDVFRGATGSAALTLAGIVCSGCLQANDRVILQPSSQVTTVKSITIDNAPVQAAFGGDQALIVLGTAIEPSTISVGSILADVSMPAPTTNRFRARIVVFDVRVPLTQGYPVMLHIHNAEEPATISRLLAEVSKTTGEVKSAKIKCLPRNSSGLVEIETSQPIVVDLYKECKDLGRFLLRSGSSTLAAGVVVEMVSYSKFIGDFKNFVRNLIGCTHPP